MTFKGSGDVTIQAGDPEEHGIGDEQFNQLDIIQMLEGRKYLRDEPADWTEATTAGSLPSRDRTRRALRPESPRSDFNLRSEIPDQSSVGKNSVGETPK